MICRNCLRRASALRPVSQFSRNLTTTSLRNSEAATPALGSSAQQPPFSTPLTNLPNSKGVYAKPKPKTSTELPVSITPAGQALAGINYIKGKPDPIALEETEYPEWLWHVLDGKPMEEGSEDADGDQFAKSKKVRRAAAKRQRKLEARLAASGNLDALTPKVPLTRQTIDLPGNKEGGLEGALEAEGKRQELTEAMRKERRKGIKSANFLKSM